ncbi:hypothetical protein [Streptomyces chrestomyceticus]
MTATREACDHFLFTFTKKARCFTGYASLADRAYLGAVGAP